MYLGEFELGKRIIFMFTTRASTGVPTVLAGSPVITIWQNSSTTGEKTSAVAGITLSVSFDGVVGLNLVEIDTEAETTGFFIEDRMYNVVITTGTVNSVSVVGEHVGTFLLKSAAAPAVAPSASSLNLPPKDSPSGFNITSGETEVNTEDSVHVPDGTLHKIQAILDTTEKIEVYYEFATSITSTATMYTAKHYLDGSQTGAGQSLIISAWNFTDSAWNQIGELKSRVGMRYDQYSLLVEHTEFGVGTVRIQYKTGSGTFQPDTELNVDHAFVSFVASGVNVLSIKGDTTAATNLEKMYDGTGYIGGTIKLGVDVVKISDDAGAADNAELFFDGTGYIGGTIKLGTDVVKISGEATPADNLQLMYDGTGYGNGTAPSSRDQIDALGGSVGSGQINYEASEDNSGGTIDPGSTVFVGNETNNYTDTALANGTYHVITDDSNVIDLVYGFNIGGNSTATIVEFKGFANANNDDLNVRIWDHVGEQWEIVGTLEGKSGTADESLSISVLSRHTGTSLAEIGKVYVRFDGTSLSGNADLNTNQILVGAVSSASAAVTPGYAVGSIWVDTNGLNTNAVAYVDGLADNPVGSWADALTVSAATNITDFHILNGSSVTFTAAVTNYSLFGDNYSLNLNGQSCVGLHVEGASLSGAMAGTGAQQSFTHCEVATMSVIKDTHFLECGFSATLTLIEAGQIYIEDSHSTTTACKFDFGNGIGASGVHYHTWSGFITLEQETSADTAIVEGWGKVTEGTCSGGTLTISGNITIASITNLTLSDDARIDVAQINSECDASMVTYGLDHLVQASVTGSDVADNSIIARLASKASTADWDTFNNTTDSLEALRDFFASSIVPEITAVVSSSLQTGTYIKGATEDVRRYTDEPNVNAKWNDADILAKLNEAWAEVYVDITFNEEWPVLVKYNVSFSDGAAIVILPPNVGEMIQVAKMSEDGSRQVIWELDTRSQFDVSGWGVRITGNTMELGSSWQGATEIMELMYIPNGVVAPLDGKWIGSETFTGTSITLATTATNGNLPTLPNCLAGYMFRTVPAAGTVPVDGDSSTIQQEHLITAYNPVTRVATLATDLNPSIDISADGTVIYEIVPLLHPLLRGIVAVRASQNILSAEGNKDRAGMLALEYRRKMRSLKLQVASINGRKATQFEGGTRDDPRSRSNRWGI